MPTYKEASIWKPNRSTLSSYRNGSPSENCLILLPRLSLESLTPWPLESFFVLRGVPTGYEFLIGLFCNSLNKKPLSFKAEGFFIRSNLFMLSSVV
jgi:hypothetical protein